MTPETVDGLCCHRSAMAWFGKQIKRVRNIIAFSPNLMFQLESKPPRGPAYAFSSRVNLALSIRTAARNLGILGLSINSLKYKS
jgi:hypothetical protein